MKKLALALGLILVSSTAFAQGRTGAGSPGQQAFDEGVRLLNSDDLPGAEQKFREAVQLDASMVPAYGKLGAVLFAEKKYKEAVDLLKKCPDQNDIEVREQLGLNLDKMGNPDAVKILEGVVKDKPDSFASQLVLGLHYAKSETKKAPAALEAYLKYRPASASSLDNDIRQKLGTAYLFNRDWSLAQNQFEILLKNKLSQTGELAAKLGLGAALVAQKECGRAISLYEGMLKDAPRQPSILYNLGVCYRDEKRYSDAEREASLYTRAKSTDAKGYVLLGDSLYEQGKYQPALGAYQNAKNSEKGGQQAIAQIVAKIGRTDVKLHNYDAAMSELQQAAASAPNDVDVLCAQVEVYAAKKMKEQLNSTAEKLSPLTRDAKALKCAAVAYVANGNDEKANTTLEASREIDPKNAETIVELVNVKNRLAGKAVDKNDLVRAANLLEDAKRLSPENSHTLRNQALVLLLEKKCAEAENPLRVYLKKQPNDIAANRLMGRALQCQNKRKDALAAYERAVTNAQRSRGVELAMVWTELGPLYVEEGKTDMAISLLDQAVKESGAAPVAQTALHNLYWAYFQRGLEKLKDPKQADQALEDIVKASQAPPNMFTAKETTTFACYEAVAAIRAKKPREAEDAVARAKKGGGCQLKAPYDKFGTAHLEYLASYADNQDPAKREQAAKGFLAESSKASPTLVDGLRSLARSALELAAYDFWQKGDEKRAEADLKQAAKVPAKGERHELDHNLGVIDLFFGRVAPAEKEFNAVSARVPEALVNLGIIKDKQGDGRGALELYRRAWDKGVRAAKLKEWIDVKERLWGAQ